MPFPACPSFPSLFLNALPLAMLTGSRCITSLRFLLISFVEMTGDILSSEARNLAFIRTQVPHFSAITSFQNTTGGDHHGHRRIIFLQHNDLQQADQEAVLRAATGVIPAIVRVVQLHQSQQLRQFELPVPVQVSPVRAAVMIRAARQESIF